MKCKIHGSGYYAPETVVTNDDLSKIMDTNNEWIITRTGIKERRFSLDKDASHMAIEACRNAIKEANIDVKDIGVVIVATITSDDITPSVACKILEPLGIKTAMAFDLNAACSGFVYSLNVASALLSTSSSKYALVVGSEKLSKILDYTDRSTSILFGDGAGAVVISNDGEEVFYSCNAKTDIDNVLYANNISDRGYLKNSVTNNFYLHMNGQEVFKFAVDKLKECIETTLEQSNLTIEEIDYIIPHQANVRILQNVSKKLDIPLEKFYINLERFGNTSAASVPIALAEAIERKVVKKGHKLIIVGFGSGLTWASMYIKL
ncbi:MAG: beta-ketoacyl-ACP synthase III [Anaeroplasmataceae bacterium]